MNKIKKVEIEKSHPNGLEEIIFEEVHYVGVIWRNYQNAIKPHT